MRRARGGLSMRMRYLIRWYGMGAGFVVLSTSHGRSRRDGTRP